jgi:hypothetical protein
MSLDYIRTYRLPMKVALASSYVFTAIVKELPGIVEKIYVVNFEIK